MWFFPDGVTGCPHEEGIDYPLGEPCPQCPCGSIGTGGPASWKRILESGTFFRCLRRLVCPISCADVRCRSTTHPFHLIELKWQKIWEEQRKIFRGRGTLRRDYPRATSFFATAQKPSGQVLHSRHVPLSVRRGTACRTSGRLHGHGHSRALPPGAAGFNVLHPMGWDAFGLPAEQYADPRPASIRASHDGGRTSPRSSARSNRLGFSYDWTPRRSTRPIQSISNGRSGFF